MQCENILKKKNGKSEIYTVYSFKTRIIPLWGIPYPYFWLETTGKLECFTFLNFEIKIFLREATDSLVGWLIPLQRSDWPVILSEGV